jgi:hypothetical protein
MHYYFGIGMKTDNKPRKSNPKKDSEFIETLFGSRKISSVNQSRMIAIPKMALQNVCGSVDGLTVNVSLVQNGKEKFLKLVPVCNTEKIREEENDNE